MKKIMLVISMALLLSGCESLPNDKDIKELEDNFINVKQQGSYEEDKVFDLMHEIEKIDRDYDDKYREEGNDFIGDVGVSYQNNGFQIIDIESYNHEYINEIVKLLDSTVSSGIKNHVENVLENEAAYKDSHRFGNSLVFVDEDNNIVIRTFTNDIKDKYLKNEVDDLTDGSYITWGAKGLDGNKIISIKNIDASTNYSHTGVRINYNMFYDERNLSKVLALIETKDESSLTDDDIEMFENILDKFAINDYDKKLIVDEFIGAVDNKVGKKEIDIAYYKVKIMDSKAEDKVNGLRRIYFLVEN